MVEAEVGICFCWVGMRAGKEVGFENAFGH